MITQTLSNPTAWLILILLAATTSAYAWRIVRPLRRRNPDHGQTAWLVVVGTAATGIAYAILLALSIGAEAAAGHIILLMITNIASGLPMIIEYIDDHTDRSQNSADRSLLNEIRQILED